MAMQNLRRRRIPQASGAPTFAAPDPQQRPAQMPTGSTTTGTAPEGPPQQGGGELLGMGMMGMQASNKMGAGAVTSPYSGYQYGANELAPQSAAYEGSSLSGAGRVAPMGEGFGPGSQAMASETMVSPNVGFTPISAAQTYPTAGGGLTMYSPEAASAMNASAADTLAFTGSGLEGGSGLLAAEAAPTMAVPAEAAATEGAAALGADAAGSGALLGMGPWGWAALGGLGLLAADPFEWFG